MLDGTTVTLLGRLSWCLMKLCLVLTLKQTTTYNTWL